MWNSQLSSNLITTEFILKRTGGYNLQCNLQFFSERITTQLRISHGVTANPLRQAMLQVLLKLCVVNLNQQYYITKKWTST